MRRVPLFGPHAGRVCTVLADGTLEPLPEVTDSASHPRSVALPDLVDAPDAVPALTGGEIGGVDTRGSIQKLARKLYETGFSDPEGRAREIARRWDRDVRSGAVQVRRS